MPDSHADLGEMFRLAIAESRARSAALSDLFQRFENADLIGRVVVHRYRCKKCSKLLATVIRGGDHLLIRTSDYKYGKGMNLERTVESARQKNTLNGDNHWPGHTFDVHEVAEWDSDGGVSVVCRHTNVVLHGKRIIEDVGDKRPGHAGAPTFL